MSFAYLILLPFVPRLILLFLAAAYERPVVTGRSAWVAEDILRHGFLNVGRTGTAEDFLYPLFLAFCHSIAPGNYVLILILQFFVAGLGSFYFYKLCLILAEDRQVSLVACLLYSFYPYWVYQGIGINEVTFTATFLIIAAYYFVRSRGKQDMALSGFALGLATLTRAPIVLIGIMATLALVIKRRFPPAVIFIFVLLIPLLPVAYRNYHIDGSFFPTRSGENLFKGNSQYSDQLIPDYNVDLLYGYVYGVLEEERPDIVPPDRHIREVPHDMKKAHDFFQEKALAFMIAHPWRTLRLKVLNFFYLFYPRLVPFYHFGPDTRVVFLEGGGIRVDGSILRDPFNDWVYGVGYGLILACAIPGIIMRRRAFGRDLFLYLVVLGFVLVNTIYWPSTRTRTPMDFVLMFYAAYAIRRVAGRLYALRAGSPYFREKWTKLLR